MAYQLSPNKFVQDTPHGRVIVRLSDRGVHVQNITEISGGQIIAHDEKVHSYQDVLDWSDGQLTIPIHGQ
jgi:hypothetical protein